MSIVNSTLEECPTCNGTGWMPDMNLCSSATVTVCMLCQGSGQVWRTVNQTKPEELTSLAYKSGHEQGYKAALMDCAPYLRAYAQLLWFNGQLNENAKVCALLGEPSAIEHEGGGDAP